MRHSRFSSRKFILALSAQVVAILTLFFADSADHITEVGTNITALILSLGTAFGYISAEAKVDAAREANK